MQHEFGVHVSKDYINKYGEGIRVAHTPTYYPNKPLIFTENGLTYVNKWTGWDVKEGDTSPFTDLLSASLTASEKEVTCMLDTIAKRMQSSCHIPYGIVFMGCIETANVILSCLEAAFGKHCVSVLPSYVYSPRKAWLSLSSLVICRNGRQFCTTKNFSNGLTNIIMTDAIHDLHPDSSAPTQKHRRCENRNRMLFVIAAEAQAMPKSYAKYLAFPSSCMAFQVVRPSETIIKNAVNFYKSENGGPALANFFVNRDLSAFELSHFAPPTQFRNLMIKSQETPFVSAVKDALASGENPCATWISRSLEWADAICASAAIQKSHHFMPASKETAEAIRAFMPELKISPFYTAAELIMMFPEAMSGEKYRAWSTEPDIVGANVTNPKYQEYVAHELRSAGVHILPSENPKGFLRSGKFENFFVVHDQESWKKPLTQEEFEKVYESFGTYRDYVRLGGKYGKSSDGKTTIPLYTSISETVEPAKVSMRGAQRERINRQRKPLAT